MPAIPVARRSRAFQYNGTNSAEMLAAAAEFNLAIDQFSTMTATSVSGSGFTLNLFTGGIPLVSESVALNDWMVLDKSQPSHYLYTPATFAERYYTYEQASNLITDTTAFKTALAGSASAMGAVGITVPGLGNANFDVPIRPMQPSTSFTATPYLTGGASLLGNLAMTGLSGGATGTVQNANKLSTVIGGVTWYDRVRVNVANSGALQVTGANLLVHVSP